MKNKIKIIHITITFNSAIRGLNQGRSILFRIAYQQKLDLIFLINSVEVYFRNNISL